MMGKMRFAFQYLGVIILVATLLGCSTAFDVNAPYKETPTLYALLNPDDDIQVVRINKGFQSRDANGKYIAKNIADSSQYSVGTIKVELYQKNRNGSYTKLNDFAEQQLTDKDTIGDFVGPNQLIYVINKKINYQPGTTYKVVATNQKTGTVVSAEDVMQGPATTSRPLSGSLNLDSIAADIAGKKAGGINYKAKSIYFSINQLNFSDKNTQVTVNQPCYAAAAQINMAVTVLEFNSSNAVVNTIKFSVPRAAEAPVSGVSTNCGTKDQITANISGPLFFGAVVANVKPNPAIAYRRFYPDYLTYYTVTEAVNNYVQVNNSFSTITATQPIYTNVQGGLGIVGTRRMVKVPYWIDQGTYTNYINGINANTGLPNNQEMKDLKFVY